MDLLQLGRALGHLEARMTRTEEDIRQLKSATPRHAEWRQLVPYLIYGSSLIGLAIAGKITWLQVLEKLAP